MHCCPRGGSPASGVEGVGLGPAGSRGVHQSQGPPPAGEADLLAPLPLDAPCVPPGLRSRPESRVRSVNRVSGFTVYFVRLRRERADVKTKAQLSTVDPSARASMKNAANCDT